MVGLEVFKNIMYTELNNPDCSFLSGVFLGELFSINNVIILLIIFGVFKIIDKLALIPFLDWLKLKFRRNEKNGKMP